MIWHNVPTGTFFSQFENKDNIFQMEGFFGLSYEFFYCVDISVNKILTEPGVLVQWNCGFSPGCFKWVILIINSEFFVYYVCGLWSGYVFSFNEISSYILYSIVYTRICICGYWLFTSCMFLNWTYHEYLKWIKFHFKYCLCRQVSACFVCLFCVIGQFSWPWLMIYDILLKIS